MVPLVASGASEAWFGYRDQRAGIGLRLRTEAIGAASRIEGFLDNIRDQLGWDGPDPLDRRLRGAPSVRRAAPAAAGAVDRRDHRGRRRRTRAVASVPHRPRPDRQFDRPRGRSRRAGRARWARVVRPGHPAPDSEPYAVLAVAGSRPSAGITIAVINLKLIWDVISTIRFGQSGEAFVLDANGRLVAHPDIGLVLRGEDNSETAALRDLHAAAVAAGGAAITGIDAERRRVFAAMAPIAGPGWSAFAVQPIEEAFAPIRAALERDRAARACRRRICRTARLCHGAAHGRADPSVGTGRGAHRCRPIRRQDRHHDGRTNWKGWRRASIRWRSSSLCRRSARSGSPVSNAFCRRRWPSWSTARARTICSTASVPMSWWFFCDLRGFTAFAGQTDGRRGHGPAAGILRDPRRHHHAA